MATNRTTNKAERAKRLEQVATLYLQQNTQTRIAEIMGVTQQQINYDLKKLREKWLQSAVRDFEQAKAQELARLDELERTYWRAWENSREAIEPAEGSDEPVKYKGGDPRYLSGVHRCIEKRCQLLGLDEPIKKELTGKGGEPLIPGTIQVEYIDPSDLADSQ